MTCIDTTIPQAQYLCFLLSECFLDLDFRTGNALDCSELPSNGTSDSYLWMNWGGEGGPVNSVICRTFCKSDCWPVPGLGSEAVI